MKKAEEYAEMYRASNGSDEILGKILTSMLGEITELTRLRNARTDQAMVAILEEIDNKWRVLARKVPGINPEGFKLVHKKKFPDVYNIWESTKKWNDFKKNARPIDLSVLEPPLNITPL